MDLDALKQLPIAQNAWHGGVKFPELAQTLPRHGFTLFAHFTLNTRTKLGIPVTYRISPVVSSVDDQAVVYFQAYSPETKTVDYVISPEALDSFIENAAMLAGCADSFHIFAGSSGYKMESALVIDLAMDGKIGAAFGALGKSWWSAFTDPEWWFNLISSYGATGSPKAQPLRNVGKTTLTPAEMSVHLHATWQANPILEDMASARAASRNSNVPMAQSHRLYVSLLAQFEEETGTAVQVVPKGAVQAQTRPKNLASLHSRPGVLQIEEQVFRSTPTLMNEVDHELAAYYSGAPQNKIPQLGTSPFFAHDLLEMRIQSGRWPTILPPPPSSLPRLLTLLGVRLLRYPPKDDDDVKSLSELSMDLGVGPKPAPGKDKFAAFLAGLNGPPGPEGKTGELFTREDCRQKVPDSPSWVCVSRVYFKASRDVTLSEVAQFAYGDWLRWQQIHQANKKTLGDNPNVGVKKGQVLYIP